MKLNIHFMVVHYVEYGHLSRISNSFVRLLKGPFQYNVVI